MIRRPFFDQAWARFTEVRMSVAEVGNKLGGKVEANIAAGTFANACPIRISYVLNHCGVPIPGPSGGYPVVSGKDGKWHIYRVKDMMTFVEKTFGAADRTQPAPRTSHFDGLQGLMIVRGRGWNDATGHVTLWDGYRCSDTCHLLGDPENGGFVPAEALLWQLPSSHM